MTWGLVIAEPAIRLLSTVPRTDAARIIDALEEMRDDPYQGDIKFLKGPKRGIRRRVGDFRIFFDVRAEKRLVVVLSIARRGSNTY